MVSETENSGETAELVVACSNLDETLEFFTGRLAFRLLTIFPADDPVVAVVSGGGLRLRLERTTEDLQKKNEHIRIRLNCPFPEQFADGGGLELIAPNGVRIELIASNPPLILPELKPSFVLSRFSESADWVMGRAGMRYRDLIPDRQGGRFIASHIHIPTGGPVPDYVHFHKIRFQMIYCRRGSARLVYQDQGEPFLLNAGDCVLQPPEIRHRVLESSANLEVIEIACPAEHETHSDHALELPNTVFDPERDFGGQRFVRHQASEGVWEKWRIEGFECLDTGIGSATNGLASVKTVRPVSRPKAALCRHDAEFFFIFILQGNVSSHRENGANDLLNAGDSLVIPAGLGFAFSDCSPDLQMLEVALPEKFETKSVQKR